MTTMTEVPETTPDADAARKRIMRQRNYMMAGVLLVWAVLIFAISIVKMS
jgi:hypothetical protein